MPVNFSSIPELIQREVVTKLEIYDFLAFHTASRDSFNLANRTKTCITASVEEVLTQASGKCSILRFFDNRWKVHIIRANHVMGSLMRIKANTLRLLGQYLTQEVCELLMYFSSNLSFSILNTIAVECSPETFNELLEKLNITGLQVTRSISPTYLRVPSMANISTLYVDCNLEDEDFLALKIPKLILFETHITNRGLNKLLKQWLNDQREISEIMITMMATNRLQCRHMLDGIVYEHLLSYQMSETYLVFKDKENELIVTVEYSRCVNIKHYKPS